MEAQVERLKIVVGMMVDQMRWDYLYYYNNEYCNGGLKRLLRDGFSCENTMINYIPTITAIGHTSVYTDTTHYLWNLYDSHLPLVFIGWNVQKGATARITHIVDIAPTLCAMLHIQMPDACIGEPVKEVVK